MGKHHIKCLGCGCEKDNNPELKFHILPLKRERRALWLMNLNRIDLINTKISYDFRVCENHFTSDMFTKSKLKLKRMAIPIKGKTMNHLEDVELASPKSPRGTEIVGSTNKEVIHQLPETSCNNSRSLMMDKLPGTFYDEYRSFISPITHKAPTQTSSSNVSENQLNKLRKHCEVLKQQIIDLTKEKDSYAFYVERTRRILPEQLARIVESHIVTLHHNPKEWRSKGDVETDCVKLINLVKERPALYNAGCVQYRDSNKRMRLWDEVSAGMIENWHTLDEAEKKRLGSGIQERWYSIRDSFSRELEHLKKSATETSAYKSSTYLHFDELLFLIPHLHLFGAPAGANVTPQIKDAGPVPGSSKSLPNKRKKRKRISSTKAIMKVLKKRLQSLRGKTDEDERFLLSLLPSIKKYDNDSKLKLRMEILSTVLNFKDAPSSNFRVHITTPSNIAYFEPIPAASSSIPPTNSDNRILLPSSQKVPPDSIPKTCWIPSS